MRVVVLGGYGVFGSRLCRLLARDGHAVWIAGRRRDRAAALARDLGPNAYALVVDRTGDPDAALAVDPDVIVDAAGPFGTYADLGDPYRVARLCVRHGIDYLDLSDDAGFTAGIAVLDAEARSAGCRVLSGASSVPGLSSAAVAELSRGMTSILRIDGAILPGNRAPRGASVIAGIVAQLGRPLRVWHGGRWREERAWGAARRIALAPDLVRRGRMIAVPDLALFPSAFGARSVTFHAGLELRALDLGLRVLAAIRRVWPFAVTPGRAAALRRLAALTEPFGSDRGGMRVAVVGTLPDAPSPVEREWRLVVEGGDGPFVPGVVCRAVLRRLERDPGSMPPGARPAIAAVSLAEAEAAMADLAARTDRRARAHPALFQTVLGPHWDGLPPALRALDDVHDQETFTGAARVVRGRTWRARLVAAVFGFPPAGDDVPVQVTKTRVETPRGPAETWERRFGPHAFRSRLAAGDATDRVTGQIEERFGPFAFDLALSPEGTGLRWTLLRGRCLGCPLPAWLLPKTDTREGVDGGVFRFDVALFAPLGGGLIVRYEGWLRPDADRDGQRAANGSHPGQTNRPRSERLQAGR